MQQVGLRLSNDLEQFGFGKIPRYSLPESIAEIQRHMRDASPLQLVAESSRRRCDNRELNRGV